jgi:hypothetical protein
MPMTHLLWRKQPKLAHSHHKAKNRLLEVLDVVDNAK